MTTKAQREINHKPRYLSTQIRLAMFHLLVVILVFLEILFITGKNYKNKGLLGLINSKPCPKNPTLRTLHWIVEKILYLRKTYHFGQQRIS